MSRQVGVLLFDGFELLDVFGPVELWSRLSDRYEVTFCAVEPGPVRSSQGAAVMATEDMDASAGHDIVLIQGGMGTRSLVDDRSFLTRLRGWATPASIISSVCTGSACWPQRACWRDTERPRTRWPTHGRPPTAGTSGGNHEHDGCMIVTGGPRQGLLQVWT